MAGTTGLEPATSDVTGTCQVGSNRRTPTISANCANRAVAYFDLLQYVLQFTSRELCQIWHTMDLVPERPTEPRQLIWLVDSLDRLSSFPIVVRKKLGFALYQAQIGQQHESTKILRGYSDTVWQVRADDPSGTYRVVYVAQLGDAIYVLHVFQKKATSGIATPRRELDLIRHRLQLARKLAGK